MTTSDSTRREFFGDMARAVLGGVAALFVGRSIKARKKQPQKQPIQGRNKVVFLKDEAAFEGGVRVVTVDLKDYRYSKPLESNGKDIKVLESWSGLSSL